MLGPWAFTITLSSERSCFFIKMGYYCFLLWKVRLHYLMELTRQDGRMFQGTREREMLLSVEKIQVCIRVRAGRKEAPKAVHVSRLRMWPPTA